MKYNIFLATELTVCCCQIHSNPFSFCIYFTVILPGKLTENMFSFTATAWGIVTGERRGNK
jgi:hypothetical protein